MGAGDEMFPASCSEDLLPQGLNGTTDKQMPHESIRIDQREKQVIRKKDYLRTRFDAEVIREALDVFLNEFDLEIEQLSKLLSVANGPVEWTHDSIEEFLSDYRQSLGFSWFRVEAQGGDAFLRLGRFEQGNTSVEVKGETRQKIESVFEVFEKYAPASEIPTQPEPPPPRPKVFIGHGRNLLWRELKDHLQDKHAFEVLAYEIGARAGHEIRDILEEMLEIGTLAILVMTGEDETVEGLLMPRLNVVHELGLFQGRLGFSRAIVLLEEGTQEFSNIHGTHQIRFPKCRIKETFGDVLATLNREFL